MASVVTVSFSGVPNRKSTGLTIKFNAAVKKVTHVGGAEFPVITGIASSRIRLSGIDAGKCVYTFNLVNNNPKVVKAMWTRGTKYTGKAKHRFVPKSKNKGA